MFFTYSDPDEPQSHIEYLDFELTMLTLTMVPALFGLILLYHQILVPEEHLSHHYLRTEHLLSDDGIAIIP